MARDRTRNAGNEGIVVSGRGSVTARQIAVGRRASLIVVEAGRTLETRGLREVKEKLELLATAVAAHVGPASEREQLTGSTEAVAAELKKDKPNKLTIMSVLEGIASSVKSVTSIVSASEALKAAVMAFL